MRKDNNNILFINIPKWTEIRPIEREEEREISRHCKKQTFIHWWKFLEKLIAQFLNEMLIKIFKMLLEIYKNY